MQYISKIQGQGKKNPYLLPMSYPLKSCSDYLLFKVFLIELDNKKILNCPKILGQPVLCLDLFVLLFFCFVFFFILLLDMMVIGTDYSLVLLLLKVKHTARRFLLIGPLFFVLLKK